MSCAVLRRRALLLLWLLLALLPLRGWAGLAMHLPAADSRAGAAHCHGMDSAADAAGADSEADPGARDSTPGAGSSTAACTQCELCHGAMLLPVIARAEPDRPARSWPVAVPDSAQGPAPSPLFRPPRR